MIWGTGWTVEALEDWTSGGWERGIAPALLAADEVPPPGHSMLCPLQLHPCQSNLPT